ncbi:CHASE2 domain-containing protein [Chloroflexota bacterium]
MTSRRGRKRLYHTLTLIGVGCLFTLLFLVFQPFHSVNLWLSDQLFLSEPPSENIVISGIDDETLSTYGRWSEWPRSLHAQAIDNLAEAGAKVIGYDIIFANDSPDDEMLAQAIANAGNTVLATVGSQPLPITDPQITYDHFILPTAILQQASSVIGHANVAPDPDGTVRRLPLIVKDAAGTTYPAFTLAALHTLFSMPFPQEYPINGGSIYLFARDIPVDNSYNLRLNFSPDSYSRPYISYRDVITGSFDPSLVRNKIVLVGMTATGEPDTWAIPTSASKIPGVFIHAAAIDTILRQLFLVETNILIAMLTMLLLVGITAFLLPRCGTWYWTDIAKGAGIIVGLFIAYLVASFLAFDNGYVLTTLYPILLLIIIYVSNLLYMIITEQADKRFVKELFGKYISPEIVQEIVSQANEGKLDLGGSQREATILFADIRNFTQISERLSPEGTVKMLNTYLAVMVDKVIENGGIVNKFAGDNIMGVWNAPQSKLEHARLAAKAAWEAQEKVKDIQQDNTDLPPIQFGIGINTGTVLAGNIGSSGRAEYTVIGDAVNLAARICGAAAGGEILIGARTYQQAAENLEVEELEPQRYKGITEAVSVFRVLAIRP